MGILEMDFERILGGTIFISSFHSIMLWIQKWGIDILTDFLFLLGNDTYKGK